MLCESTRVHRTSPYYTKKCDVTRLPVMNINNTTSISKSHCNTVKFGVLQCFRKALWDTLNVYIRMSDPEIYGAIGLLDNREKELKD